MPADTFAPGLLVPAVDETKPAGQKNVSITAEEIAPVREVAGRTGDVVLTTGDLADFRTATGSLITAADASIGASLTTLGEAESTLATEESTLGSQVAALEGASSGAGITLELGGTSLTRVGTLTISGGGSLTGTSGETATLGSAVLALPAGGSSGSTASTLDPGDTNGIMLSSGGTLTNGNLTLTANGSANYYWSRSTQWRRTGLLYLEVTLDVLGAGNEFSFGIGTSLLSPYNRVGHDLNGLGVSGADDFIVIGDNVAGSGITFGLAAGQVFSMAVNFNARDIWFRRGTEAWNNTGADPAAGTGGIVNGSAQFGPYVSGILKSGQCFFALAVNGGTKASVNFGATAFVNPVPTGFSAWG
jgi:hypothetical protein